MNKSIPKYYLSIFFLIIAYFFCSSITTEAQAINAFPTTTSFTLSTNSNLAISAKGFQNQTSPNVTAESLNSNDTSQNLAFIQSGTNSGYLFINNTSKVLVCVNNKIYVEEFSNSYLQKITYTEISNLKKYQISFANCSSNGVMNFLNSGNVSLSLATQFGYTTTLNSNSPDQVFNLTMSNKPAATINQTNRQLIQSDKVFTISTKNNNTITSKGFRDQTSDVVKSATRNQSDIDQHFVFKN